MPSPSPSPPPNAPTETTTAAATAADTSTTKDATSTAGTHATQLRKIYTSALTASLKANSYPNFAACFPTPARYCPSALEGVWRQLNARLQEECAKDFEKILEERSVVDNLNNWGEILEDARRRRDRGVEGQVPDGKAAHLLDARELEEAFMYGHLVHVSGDLGAKLDRTQRENQEVMERIRIQREEIQRLVGGIEGLVSDVQGAVEALESADADANGSDDVDMDGAAGVGVAGLRKEAAEMRVEVESARSQG